MLMSILRKMYRMYSSVRQIPGAISIGGGEETYYPEKNRKSKAKRVTDNLIWLFRYGEVNRFYNLYGLDIVGSDSSSYHDYLGFMQTRNTKNKLYNRESPNSQVVLLRDKLLFYKYMKSFGMPVPEVFAFVSHGKMYDISLKEIPEESIINYEDYFIKDINGECGSFVEHVNNYIGYLNLKEKMGDGSYILQKSLKQDSHMAKLNPNAINTLRIVTVNNGGEPYVLTALLRVGTKATGNVDNWARGGLAIGIGDSGYLKKWGYYKPEFGTKTDKHPDSEIVLSEFEIPFYNDALKLACDAHKLFYGIHSIGWDIAISTDGIMFIEGNDNWEISLMQVADRGLKSEWNDAIKGNKHE